MSQPFVGQIQLFPYGYAPSGWARCDGQLLPIAQNTALFSLLGTQFGGDGVRNFQLPKLSAAVAIGQGSGPGLTQRTMGEAGGEASVTLALASLTAHGHTVQGTSGNATTPAPAAALPATVVHAVGREQVKGTVYAAGGANTTLAPASVGSAGGGGAHNNLQPYLAVAYCIALTGVFPPRN